MTIVPSFAQGTLVPEPDARPVSAGAAARLAAAGDEQWNKGIGPFDVNGAVFATAVASNGDLYVGGEFTSIGGVAANRIARWNGTVWSALGDGIPAGRVYAIAFHGADVIVGGNFRGAGGVKASNIARFNGTVWTAFGDITNEGLDTSVLAIVVKGNEIYAGGNFTYAGNQDQMNFLAKWDPGFNLFVPLDDGTRRGTDGGISGMILVGDDVYVVGSFTKAGGTNASRIARWNGTVWASLTNGVGAQGGQPYVAGIAAHDTSIVIVGTFTFAGGKPMKYIARWSTASSAWYTVGGGFDSAAYRVAINGDGDVYASGDFMRAGTAAATRIAHFSNAGGWSALGSGIDKAVFSMTPIGRDLWVGGEFPTAGGTSTPNLARWSEEAPSSVDEGARSQRSVCVAIVPNPVAGDALIRIALMKAGAPHIAIVDMHGAEVATIDAGELQAGETTLRFDASQLPTGVYGCRVRTSDASTFVRFTIVR